MCLLERGCDKESNGRFGPVSIYTKKECKIGATGITTIDLLYF